MSLIKLKKVDLYLDYGTIASLSYIFDFLKNRENKEIVRFFGLGRFEFPTEIIQFYPDNMFYAFQIQQENPKEFFSCFGQYLAETYDNIELTLHLNLFHVWESLPVLLYLCSKYSYKVKNIYLNLYDDGSEGLVNQYNISQVNPDYFKKDFQNEITELTKLVQGETAKIKAKFLERYLWQRVLPTTYHFLSDAFFQKIWVR